ncbi:Uncharacterised protein [Streptococcus pneumoniae]|nr:Uncharacterised protein [Streptococcus pneumoniae]COC03380.1 Uncharacterised protein [Streptococcus pneumoniae]VME67962.1 Uncharacterised protein [Streptococcus pneumoniae]
MSNLASTSCLAFSAFPFNFSIFPSRSSAIAWNWADSGRLASSFSISSIFFLNSGSISLFSGLSCEDVVDVPSSTLGNSSKTSSIDSPASKALLISFLFDSISALILAITLALASSDRALSALTCSIASFSALSNSSNKSFFSSSGDNFFSDASAKAFS